MFVEFQHIERFGNTEVRGIENGTCFIFPKIDGTNGSVWMEDSIQVGSRNRTLSLQKDNAGFYQHVISNKNLENYLKEFPDHRLFGEWLVPHTLKTYNKDAWRVFYVFDVMVEGQYLPYNIYKEGLVKHGIKFIEPMAVIENGEYSAFVELLQKNTFLVTEGIGEGIVIKNYSFLNKFGKTIWAKIISSEFKQKGTNSESKTPEVPMVEQRIVDEFLTTALIEKEYAKIESSDGWSSKQIPKLLNVVFYSLIKEESWEFLSKHKFPTINYKTLRSLTFDKVKAVIKI
jgi:hypothetical protein